MKIGNFEIKSGIIQSPMAACTDLAFRLVARRRGMEFAFLEMVSADALIRQNVKTRDKMKSSPDDQPLGIQLVGCNPDVMGKAAKMVDEMQYFKVVDLNLGCPVDKIASHKAGSGLLREPELAQRIFKSVRAAVKHSPVTVKMRLGYNDPSGEEAVKIAKLAEQEGFCAIAVHGRTRAQGYQGKANYEAIARVKQAVKIPVIGNGDVTSPESAHELKRVSGCDAVMIGRGALGNPWVYKQVENSFDSKVVAYQPTFSDKKQTLLEHFDLLIAHYPHTALWQIRRVSAWYFNGMPGVSEFRSKINRSQSLKEARTYIEEFDDLPRVSVAAPPSAA